MNVAESVMVTPAISFGSDWASRKVDGVGESTKGPYRTDGEWVEKEEKNVGLYSASANASVCLPSFPPRHKPIVVGYALTAKKIRSFFRPTLEVLARKKGIVFVAVDPYRPLSDQGPFDIVLHKLSGKEWCRFLEDYQKEHPEVTVLDPPDAIKHLHNRQVMLQDVADLNLCDSNGKIVVPRQLTVYGDPASIPQAVDRAKLKLPLVAKPLVVDGTTKSHELSLAYDLSWLSKLEPPLVLQEFVNHGGVLFKVFIVGESIKVVRRYSLPDVMDHESFHNAGVVPLPRVSNASASADGVDLDPCVAELPPLSLLDKLSRELRRRLGLQLFNIDVIREHGTKGNYYVIDINYFPCLGKMPGYEDIFTDFILSLAKNKCRRRPFDEQKMFFRC